MSKQVNEINGHGHPTKLTNTNIMEIPDNSKQYKDKETYERYILANYLKTQNPEGSKREAIVTDLD